MLTRTNHFSLKQFGGLSLGTAPIYQFLNNLTNAIIRGPNILPQWASHQPQKHQENSHQGLKKHVLLLCSVQCQIAAQTAGKTCFRCQIAAQTDGQDMFSQMLYCK